MKARKVIALAIASLMLLSVMLAVSAMSVSAADVAVTMKKPVDGAKWYMGQTYTVSWTYPTGDPTQITGVTVRLEGMGIGSPRYDWVAHGGFLPPTSCKITVDTAWDWVMPGSAHVSIEVNYYAEPGVVASAYDGCTVTIADGMSPVISNYPSMPQKVVLGAESVTSARFCDNQNMDQNSVKVLVDGKSPPNAEVSLWMGLHNGCGGIDLGTDWLSLGKHRVTLTVADMSGNTARASWIVQVVNP